MRGYAVRKYTTDMRNDKPLNRNTEPATQTTKRLAAERWANNPAKLARALRAVLYAHEAGIIDLHGDLDALEGFAYGVGKELAA